MLQNASCSSVSGLSPAALTARLAQLVSDERALLVEFLQVLSELDRRDTVLELGYSSLFVYLTDELRLPKASAWRRTTAARLLSRFPAAAPLLADGRLCLTTFVLLREVLTPGNYLDVLARAAGRTEDEVEALVASLQPRPDVKDSIRKLPSRGSGPELLVALPPPPAAGSGPEPAQAAPIAPLPEPDRRPRIEPLSAERHLVKLTVGREFLDELAQVKSALSHIVPDGNLEAVLRACFQKTLDACARKKHAARMRSPEAPAASGSGPEPTDAPAVVAADDGSGPEPIGAPAVVAVDAGGSGPEPEPAEGAAFAVVPCSDRSRHIPAEVRRHVWERDGGCCTFVGLNGRRCCSTFQLEFDHGPVPFAEGGPSTVEGLTLHCRAHNLFLARRHFGADFMEQFAPRH